MPVCQVSGENFEISSTEKKLRELLNLPERKKKAKYIFRELSAFWPHFSIHKRKCDATGKTIYSTYRNSCTYLVWERNHWIKSANPPGIDYDGNKNFFDQFWDIAKKSPIPHNIGLGNQNCDYTDDWWYSKNCYLCHSGFQCEDCDYLYRNIRLINSMFCVFCSDCELSIDLTYCRNCYQCINCQNCRNCENCFFSFDLRSCKNCLFCYNLRNREYCISNRQYSKEEYEKILSEYQFSSRSKYDEYAKELDDIIKNKAYWKCLEIEKFTNCEGDYLEFSKNLENCFFLQENEECVNILRGIQVKFGVDSVTPCFNSERIYYSNLAQDRCYDIKYCNNVVNSKNLEYCQHMLNCENCFGCSGLVGCKYYILNKKYSVEEYANKIKLIKQNMIKSGEYGEFFPGYFAATPYEESLAAVYWPLKDEEKKRLGFNISMEREDRLAGSVDAENLPDDSLKADINICQKIYWDNENQRNFKITEQNFKFCQKMKVPLINGFYFERLKQNFQKMYFDGELRETKCVLTGQCVKTTLPQSFDPRIISEEAYYKKIY